MLFIWKNNNTITYFMVGANKNQKGYKEMGLKVDKDKDYTKQFVEF